ncbi:HEAT repeat domain-containing protein [Streptomyces umbrinus]|uniref:HEAT repeat domain-containing protein n=1 Tax=Streptomyces umbrinus TaxID=67370 RepID=UPI0033D23AE5
MGRKLEELIENLSIWQTSDYGDGDTPSPRALAIAELRTTGSQAVPALIERLDALLAITARHRERVESVQAAWTAWYEESDRLSDEHGLGVDIERYRTIPSDSLPQRSVEDTNYRDPYDLKRGIIEALHQLGDQRAAPVLIAALSDGTCVPAAARALCDIHSDQALPALLDAVTLIDHNTNKSIVFDPLLASLRHYGVSMAQARERFEAETSPQGRVRLMHLMTQLPDDGTGRPSESQIRDSLIFLALDDKDNTGRWQAVGALNKIDGSTVERDIFSDWDAPPPADVIRSAITLATHGEPLGHDRELTSRLRRIRHTAPAARAVEAVLLQDSPEPDAQELRLALRLALGVHTSELDDPLRFARTLYRLSSHSQVGDSALLALRRTCWDLLFPQMVQDDEARRREARTIFDTIATPHEHTRFAGYTASRSFWSKVRQRFRRG